VFEGVYIQSIQPCSDTKHLALFMYDVQMCRILDMRGGAALYMTHPQLKETKVLRIGCFFEGAHCCMQDPERFTDEELQLLLEDLEKLKQLG
jgi:hypothetical protein